MSKQTTKTDSELPTGTIQRWPRIIAAPAVWESGTTPHQARAMGASSSLYRPRKIAQRGSSSW